MATGFEHLGAVEIKNNDFSHLGAVPVDQGFTTGFSSPATDRGGLRFPVSRDTARRISAERLVASNRAAGLNDLFTRSEATELARQAGIPIGDIGEVVSMNQFQDSALGDVLKSAVTLRAAASASGFNVPGAVGKLIEDAILNPAQRRILGSREMASRIPENELAGTIGGSFIPTKLVANRVLAPGARLATRMMSGAQTGLPIGAITGAATTLEEQGLDTNLNDLIQNSAVGTVAGTVLGGGVSGLLGLPGAIRGTALRTRNVLDEKIAEAQRNLDDTLEVRNEFEGQIARDLQEAELRRGRAATQVGQEQEQIALEDALQRELIANAERSAQRAGSEALMVSQNIGPQLESLNARFREAPEIAGQIRGGLPDPAQPSEFGGGITSAIESEYQAAKKLTNRDYNAIKDALPSSQPSLEASNLHEAATLLKTEQGAGLSSIADRELKSVLGEASSVKGLDRLSPQAKDIYDRLPDNQKQAFLEQMGGSLTRDERPSYTWNRLQAIFQQFNERLHNAIKNEDAPSARVYATLREALNKDMEAYAQASGTEAKILFDQARSNFVAREERFGTSRIQPLISDIAKEKPNLLVQKIITGNNAPTVNNLKEILSPDQFSQVQAQYIDYLFSPSKSVAFEPSHFVKQFENVNNETIEAAFGKEGRNALNNLYKSSRGIDAINGLQKIVDDSNSIAQKAADNFRKAKTSYEERAIQNSFKSDAAKQLDDFDAQLEIIKERTKDAQTLQKIKNLERNILDARSALDKAKNPGQLSMLGRIGIAVTSLSAGYMSGHPYLGVLAAIGSGMTGERFSSKIITPIGLKLLEKASTSRADSNASRQLQKYLTETSTRIESPQVADSLEELIRDSQKR